MVDCGELHSQHCCCAVHVLHACAHACERDWHGKHVISRRCKMLLRSVWWNVDIVWCVDEGPETLRKRDFEGMYCALVASISCCMHECESGVRACSWFLAVVSALITHIYCEPGFVCRT